MLRIFLNKVILKIVYFGGCRIRYLLCLPDDFDKGPQ